MEMTERQREARAERMQSYVAIECANCGGDAWIHGQSIGAGHGDFPLGPEWHEKTITDDQYFSSDNGFCLDLTGHYGGFTDDVSGELARIVLCHECSLAVARALPGVFKPNTGWHTMSVHEQAERGNQSCCEFCWSVDPVTDEVMYGDGHGGWITKT